MEQGFEYYAFISYKREDENWAKWLQKKIESYRLPAAIRELGAFPGKLKPVFLDTTDIQPGPLEAELKRKLESSKYLILICSPRATQSNWIGEEIAHFISLGRTDYIIPVIIEGLPYNDDPKIECFHLKLKENLPEYLGANINEQTSRYGYVRKEKVFIRIMSKLLDVTFDTLWQRHKRRKIRQTICAAIFALCTLFVMAGIWKYNKPFDLQLAFNETSLHNEKLGFPDLGGTVSICFNDRDTLVKTVKDLSEIICFNDIPGRYRGRKSTLFFRLWGFVGVDTGLVLQPNIILPVARDGTYGTVHGYVRNAFTDNFVERVKVEIAAQFATTDKNGYFILNIPLDKQQRRYEVTLEFKGKAQKGQIAYPTQKEENLINTLYIE